MYTMLLPYLYLDLLFVILMMLDINSVLHTQRHTGSTNPQHTIENAMRHLEIHRPATKIDSTVRHARVNVCLTFACVPQNISAFSIAQYQNSWHIIIMMQTTTTMTPFDFSINTWYFRMFHFALWLSTDAKKEESKKTIKRILCKSIRQNRIIWIWPTKHRV